MFDFRIHLVEEAKLICDVIKNVIEKKVDIYLCLSTDQIESEEKNKMILNLVKRILSSELTQY